MIKGATIHKNCTIKFCSLTQEFTPIDNDEGRQSMREVGIYTPEDIGKWIENVLESHLQQSDVAERFAKFLSST